MKRRNLYIIGGVVALFIIIGVLGPKSEKVALQNVEQDILTPTTAEAKTLINPVQYYSVLSVVDGDTVKINVNGVVETFRLIGIDTPETVDPRKVVQCFGQESSDKAKELLSGKKVRIETDATQGTYDKYNRLLAYVYRDDGLFYNKYMIEQGYAHEYTYNTPYKYQNDFKNAQKEAQSNKMGLWSSNTCNGDTTKASSSNKVTPVGIPSSSVQFYTSSYGTSKYYYPVSCNGWKSLSPKYLKGFNTIDDLLKAYPSRKESPSC